jgi:hypothetical protein
MNNPLIVETDKVFHDSPDVGEPTCVCSRCGRPIEEDVVPIRAWIDEGRGGEYRFHPACVFPELEEDGECEDDDAWDDDLEQRF